MLEINPATSRMAALVRGVDDTYLDAPTPSDCTTAELLDHVQTLARAFRMAADKTHDELVQGPAPKPDAARLGNDWRDRIPRLLDDLAEAWAHPEAWEGMTKVGGLDLPGEVAGVVALDEVILHSWDLAVASGQRYDPPEELLDPLLPFLRHVAQPGMEAAREGLFGPVVPVAEDAPLFHRILGLSGRDPYFKTA